MTNIKEEDEELCMFRYFMSSFPVSEAVYVHKEIVEI